MIDELPCSVFEVTFTASILDTRLAQQPLWFRCVLGTGLGFVQEGLKPLTCQVDGVETGEA